MVYTLIDHRNDVIKCSKFKWNHKPQADGFTAKVARIKSRIIFTAKSARIKCRKYWSLFHRSEYRSVQVTMTK